MKTTGKHVTADVWLNEYALNTKSIVKIVKAALKKSKMNVLDSATHDFGGGAFTGVWLLAESHFSVHTFPERMYVSFDCYTCGNEGSPIAAINSAIESMDVNLAKVKIFARGEK